MAEQDEPNTLIAHSDLPLAGHQYSGISLSTGATAHLGDKHYHIQGRASQTPRPTCVIPFRRDRDFVERSILDEIWRCATQPAARLAIVGLGGVGKTQLAIEYAYRRRDADSNLWVFWVHASSATRFEESYRSIARQIQLSGGDDPKNDLLALVHAWLSDESNGHWAMVVDNADSPEVLYGPRAPETAFAVESTSSSSPRSLLRYLPSSANGSIVITSRSQEVADGITDYPEDILHVEAMTIDEGATLLSKKLRQDNRTADQDDLRHLVRELDNMPLAIAQAAAYINQRSPRSTISHYLEQLKKGDTKRTALLEQLIRDPRRDSEASNSIITTWHISFEHIRRTRDSAAQLLALMCLFDREAIPQDLLVDRYSVPKEDVNDGEAVQSRLTQTFEDDLATLRAYSLIRIGSVENLFDMHRLVQFSTRRWLELHRELVEWQIRYAALIKSVFPWGGYNDRPICQALFPHVESLMSYRVDDMSFRQDCAAVADRGARYLLVIGKHNSAEMMARFSVVEKVQLYGYDEAETLDSIFLLSEVLRHQGNYTQAEELARQALTGFKKHPGLNYRVFESMIILAEILRIQSKFTEAEELSRRAMAGSEEELGVDHLLTLSAMQTLSMVLREQGQYTESEELIRKVLVTKEKEMGTDHPDTLSSMHQLASLLTSQGRYTEAEELMRKVVTAEEKEMGFDHPDTLSSMHELAVSLRKQGRYTEAEELIRKVVTAEEKEKGFDHPSTLSSIQVLATLLRDQGKYKEAEKLTRQVLMERENKLGVEFPATLMSVYNLAYLRRLQKDYDQSLSLYNRAIDGFIKCYGLTHHNTQRVMQHKEILLREIDSSFSVRKRPTSIN